MKLLLMCIIRLEQILGWCKCHLLSKKLCTCTQVSFAVSQYHRKRTHNLCITRQMVVPLPYQFIAKNNWPEFWLYIEATDYRSNFAKTILFKNRSCCSKIMIPFSISDRMESPRIFQCLISIPAGHWVWQIDSDLPRRFFLSALLSRVISMTKKSERSARAVCDGADVVCEAVVN